MRRKDEWNCLEIDLLRKNYAKMTNQEIAKLLKRSLGAVNKKAYDLRLKKTSYGIEWTPQMLKLLHDFFPIMFNEPLAKWIGVSQRTLIRKARELGIEKEPGFLEKRKADIQRKAGEALRRRGDREGTWFKKGVRANPDGEFKPGHKESAETKAKRIAALKENYQRKKKLKILGLSC